MYETFEWAVIWFSRSWSFHQSATSRGPGWILSARASSRCTKRGTLSCPVTESTPSTNAGDAAAGWLETRTYVTCAHVGESTPWSVCCEAARGRAVDRASRRQRAVCRTGGCNLAWISYGSCYRTSRASCLPLLRAPSRTAILVFLAARSWVFHRPSRRKARADGTVLVPDEHSVVVVRPMWVRIHFGLFAAWVVVNVIVCVKAVFDFGVCTRFDWFYKWIEWMNRGMRRSSRRIHLDFPPTNENKITQTEFRAHPIIFWFLV